MDIYYDLKPGLLKQSALALGFFDGVHLGHQAVIKKAVVEAARLAVTPALVTFVDHPKSLTVGQSPQLLTLIDQRLELFEQLGIKAALVLTFSEDICKLTPRQYVKQVLVEALGARSITVGYNHHFGRNREGNPSLLKELGEKFGFSVHVARPVLVDGLEVSSSRIREALQSGQPADAMKLLGHPYAIVGQVVNGEKRGRLLGFPTANMSISKRSILPARGVYAGVARLPDARSLPCVINLGTRPTLTAGKDMAVEVHILDFDGGKDELYGRTLAVEFRHFLRAEKKFDCIDDLKIQIGRDCLSARQVLGKASGFEQTLLF